MDRKLLILAIIAIVLMASARAYTLIDSETFETYTNWAQGGNNVSFFNEAAGKWNCTDSTYYGSAYACVDPFGGDDYALGLGQAGGFNIGVEGNNNYLLEYALNGDCLDGDGSPDYIKVKLDWLHTNSSPLSSFGGGSTHIFQYKIKTIVAGGMTSCGTLPDSYFSRIYSDNQVSYGTGAEKLSSGIGGTSVCSPYSDTCYTGLRHLVFGIPARQYPANATCFVNDGNWHDVKIIYKVNSTYAIYNWTAYVDGVACQSRANPIQKVASSRIFATGSIPMRVETQGNFSVYFDDLVLYEANESENFEGAPLVYPECDDGIDNDGDGLIDYGSDPRCDNVLDDSEAPYDYVSTLCDEYSPPTYLMESFNGYLAGCGWFTTHNILPTGGALVLTSASSPYVQSKPLSVDVTSSMSRYVTLKFDLNIKNIAPDNSVAVRLYDADYNNFLILWLQGTPLTVYTTKAGVTTNMTSISYNSSYTYKVIIDFQSRTYDAYLNSTKVADNYQFIDEFGAIDDVYLFQMAALRADLAMDNIVVYASDSTGVMLPPSTTVTQASNITSMCGLFYKVTPTCTQDSDCATNDCMPNNRCNSFDMGYCDERGMVRGNKCIAGAIASCAGKNITDVALDNLLYVLAFIIILIIGAYLILITRRK